MAYTANSWSTGFTGDVTVTNTGASAINGWTVAFSFLNGQRVTSGWNAAVTQSGSSVTVRNSSYNATVPPAGTVSFGFQGTHGGTNQPPTGWTLNGSPCAT